MSEALASIRSEPGSATEGSAEGSWTDLIAVVAISGIGLSLSYIAVAMFGLSVDLFNLLGDI